MKGWKLAILVIIALFAVLFVLVRAPINPIIGILIQVVSYGLFLFLVIFFFYLAGRVYLKETKWS